MDSTCMQFQSIEKMCDRRAKYTMYYGFDIPWPRTHNQGTGTSSNSSPLGPAGISKVLRDVPNVCGAKWTFPPPGKTVVMDLKGTSSAGAAALFRESMRCAAMLGTMNGFILLDGACCQSPRGFINVKERKLTLRARAGVVPEMQSR